MSLARDARARRPPTDAPADEPAPRAAALRARLAPIFGIDPRGLAALRIGLGAVLLIDLYMRSGRFAALYTDAGVFPRAFLEPWMREWIAPLHVLGGSLVWQLLLFAIAAVAAACLAVGYRSRAAAVVSWLLLGSLQARNPAVLNFGDHILRMALFWSMFLPLGRCWSLDARRRGAPGAAARAPECSWATAAYLLQIAFVYFFTALLKNHPDWRETGLALFYALHLEYFTTPFGVWLRQFLEFTRWISFATWGLELIGPFLLFAPYWPVRTLAALAFLGLHVGIALAYFLGVFPYVDLVVLLPFLPPVVWDRIEGWLRGGRALRGRGLAPVGHLGPLGTLAVATVLAYVLLHNVHGVRPIGLPAALERAGNYLRVNQRWAMFTPGGPRFDGWWVIPATLADGRVVNLSVHGPAMRWTKPADISGDNRPFRWAVYMWMLSDPKTNHRLRVRWARWACADWNAGHAGPERMERLEMWFVFEETLPIGFGERTERRHLLSLDCASGRAQPGAAVVAAWRAAGAEPPGGAP